MHLSIGNRVDDMVTEPVALALNSAEKRLRFFMV